MTDEPGTAAGGSDGTSDPWDAWRSWTPSSGGADHAADAWDAWKSWEWRPRARPPAFTPNGCGGGCAAMAARLVLGLVVLFFLATTVLGAVGGPEDLAADELIADIDRLAVTGPRDQRLPDASAGETATFPAPGVAPGAVAEAIERTRAPRVREQSDGSIFLLYEAATVAIHADGATDAEVVVFDEHQEATRRYPLLIGVPGWSGALDDFDSRARSRGGIGGFRGGGGGIGK